MFCGKCGAQNDDNAVFCKECGAPLKEGAPAPVQGGAPAGGQGDQGVNIAGVKLPLNRNQFVGALAVLAVAIVAIIIIANLLGGGGASGTAEKFVKAMYKGDAKSIVNLLPEDMVEYMCDRYDMDKDEFIDELSETLEYIIDALDDEYSKWSVSVKTTKAKDLSEKKVDELIKKYDDWYDVDLDIKEAQEVTLELTLKADGDEETDKQTLTVIKVDGKWYIDYFSFNNVL